MLSCHSVTLTLGLFAIVFFFEDEVVQATKDIECKGAATSPEAEASLAETGADKESVEEGHADGDAFVVSQYNILAKYLGENKNPWFLYPLILTSGERDAIMAKYEDKGENGDWPYTFDNGYGGLLSAEQQRQVAAACLENFDWSNRGPRFYDVVNNLDADIMSFEELDVYEELKSKLDKNFDSAFFKRPRRSSSDGCGLFWRRSRFEIVGEPAHLTYEDWATSDSEHAFEAVSRRDRVMLAVALRDKQTGNVLVAVSTHLMRNPEVPDKDNVRMLELAQLMSKVSYFVSDMKATGLVVAGDLNALPNSWSHLFLLKNWPECAGSEKAMTDAFAGLEAKRISRNRMPCTSRTGMRSMWIDYIFYSGTSLELERADVEECPDDPIPNSQHPSDHTPVKATFKFRKNAKPLTHCEPSKTLEATEPSKTPEATEPSKTLEATEPSKTLEATEPSKTLEATALKAPPPTKSWATSPSDWGWLACVLVALIPNSE